MIQKIDVILKLIFAFAATLSHLRIPGVLQRFGISYFVSASLKLASITVKAKINSRSDVSPKFNQLLKFLVSLSETIIYFLFVLLYLLGTFALNYDDQCPKGYQGPGGLHHNASYFNCTGGAANYLDRLILGENHLYKKATSEVLYSSTIAHDPEGILGTANSIALTGLGVYTGYILTKYQNSIVHAITWLGTALTLGM